MRAVATPYAAPGELGDPTMLLQGFQTAGHLGVCQVWRRCSRRGKTEIPDAASAPAPAAHSGSWATREATWHATRCAISGLPKPSMGALPQPPAPLDASITEFPIIVIFWTCQHISNIQLSFARYGGACERARARVRTRARVETAQGACARGGAQGGARARGAGSRAQGPGTRQEPGSPSLRTGGRARDSTEPLVAGRPGPETLRPAIIYTGRGELAWPRRRAPLVEQVRAVGGSECNGLRQAG